MKPSDYKIMINDLKAIHTGDHFPRFIEGHTLRTLLKNGQIIDPKNQINQKMDLAFRDGVVCEVSENIERKPDDLVIDCQDLIVMPGLLDIHLHLGDLFDVFERPLFKAARDGVTLGLSPGAGNTFMAPSLLGAEVDRGIPINAGVYLGAGSVLATRLSRNELISLFCGRLSDRLKSEKLSRNAITNATANLTVGIKDHMGHFIMSDESIDDLFETTSQAKIIYMSHTQDPEHAERMARLSKGRPLHLAHATAAGCGTHGDPVESLKRVIYLVNNDHMTAEFVSSMLLPSRGRWDGLRIDPRAQDLAYQALQDGIVNVIVSDGQSGAVMKGFGDTRDNIACIFTLAELGVLSLLRATGTMTANPARFLSLKLDNPFFENKLGHLGIGAFANITIVDQHRKETVFTIINGLPVSFEDNLIRENLSAGCLVSKFGLAKRTGIGDLTLLNPD